MDDRQKAILKTFVDNFNEDGDGTKPSSDAFEKVEKELKIKLPDTYRNFLLSYGYVYSPGILDLIVDKEKEMRDIQEFVELSKFVSTNQGYWNAGMPKDLLAFASDCMGNMLCFKIPDLKSEKVVDAKVYFFDHELVSEEEIASSFVDLIEHFNQLK